MTDEPVIILQGPRSVGKSTVLRDLAGELDVRVIDLDDPATRAAVAADPSIFVTGSGPILIDEYQHVPELLQFIKAELRDATPGRFVLTGSTRHESLGGVQALTGRLHIEAVLPLSQIEQASRGSSMLPAVCDMENAIPRSLVRRSASTTTRDEYVKRVTTGGFPLAIARDTLARGRWFDSYVKLMLERDVAELARIDQKAALPVLLNQLSACTGQVLNMARIGRDADMDRKTAGNYTELLESVFMVYRLPSWGTTLRARVSKHPKLHVVDSGLAARLLRLSEEKLSGANAADMQQFGHLLETFAVGEVRAQLAGQDSVGGLGHWRTHDGDEVDLVVELADGSILAIEVKAGSRVRPDDWKGLRALRNATGDRFRGGVLLYLGAYSYALNEGIAAIPMDQLWSYEPEK